ncbi:serine/threonine-protein kinase [Paraliomyxa miuraensis]|uniref:serine/threonine-protein kinase n=1 Tax=Paraliomyxa miuraensis TaxID=376150 RepID=UPI0022558AA1|nr:serine/threonine-protein kinase [Paraliomyxa miuraensis]MCX4241348.1 tetratricopeptide repeat-containing serine/threonine protein kinase [Paraliomyxa miuraensis]
MVTTDSDDAMTVPVGDGEASLPGDDAASLHEQTPEVLRERYALGEVLGRGGLGVVIAALDRQLKRRVAIKLIRAAAYVADERSRAADRMLLEARALAQLSHENVVSVFDVGSYALGDGERGVFVVMELLEGPSLSQWLGTTPPVSEILRVFRLAGEGLAAAHRRGLVHRDFKPANVVLDARGIPKVVDFGLALIAQPGWESLRGTDPSGSASSSSAVMMVAPRVTQTGIVLGTPRYMAPEQHAGESIGPAADQYAFCASLWEALRGEPVFGSNTFDGLARSKLRRQWAPATEDRTPAGLVPVLQRGLSPEPAERWPDMPALLVALRSRRSARSRALALLGGLAAVGGLAVAWGMGDRSGCDAPQGPLTTEVRTALERRLSTSASAQELALIEARASQRATDIVDGFVRACEAHRDGTLDATGLDRRVACLRRSSDALEGALAIITESETLTPDKAFDTIAGLGPVADCDDDGRLAQQLPPPSDPEVAAAVDELRGEMSRVESLDDMGRTQEAAERHAQALARAEGLGYRPLVVELIVQGANRALADGRFEPAKELLERALMEAQELGHDAIAAQAASALVFVVGNGLSRHDEGLRLAETALALVHRAGDPPRTLARLHGAIGGIEANKRNYAEGIRQYERAIEILGAGTEPDPGELTVLLGGLAITLQHKGDLEAAAEKQRQVLAIREEMLVPTHPAIGVAALNLGNTLTKQQKWEEAEALLLRAIESFERPSQPTIKLAYPLVSLGVVYKKQGRYDEAAALYERAIEVVEQVHGPNHSLVGQCLINLANVEKRRGNLERARELGRAAVRSVEGRMGDESPELASPLIDLADIEVQLGALDVARRDYARAIAILEAGGHADRELAAALTGLGNLQRDAGELDEARVGLSRAREILGEREHIDLPHTLLALGKLERRAGRPEEAEALLREALGGLERLPDAKGAADEARLQLAQLERERGR